MHHAIATLLLCGCGRVGFDAPSADTVPDAPSQVIPPGAKIWLRMETDPTVAIVDSAGGHTSSCYNASCPTLVAGVHGNGYAFTTNEIDIAPAADLDPSASFSGAIWLKLTALPGSLGCIWDKPWNISSLYDTLSLCIQTSGASEFDSESPNGVTDSEIGATLAVGAWHHIAMTWDGTTKRNYFDGVQFAPATVSIGAANMGLMLGGFQGSFHVPAVVDDAVYYTRALTAAEIAQLATP